MAGWRNATAAVVHDTGGLPSNPIDDFVRPASAHVVSDVDDHRRPATLRAPFLLEPIYIVGVHHVDVTDLAVGRLRYPRAVCTDPVHVPQGDLVANRLDDDLPGAFRRWRLVDGQLHFLAGQPLKCGP
jgi:hypothetical protein